MREYAQTPVIVVLAHLPWNFVWQRPQHLLSRLAKESPVLYINEPDVDPLHKGEPTLKLISDKDGVTAYQMIYPDRRDVLDNWRQVFVGLVQGELQRRGWLVQDGTGPAPTRPIILWFYTPMPSYVLDHLPASAVVYDIMDELANFKFAPADIKQRESDLISRAHVVFTGGRSMYEARQGIHPNLHLFSSGVEPEHFAQALDPDFKVAPEIANLPRPVLGYYGVIDERLDLDLLRQVAEQRPDWSIAMVGPSAKIDPNQLPKPPNIIYPGQQPYEQLPHFLKGFDVCLMPFAINEATRYISPTKTLEYMAAHKPIVSTPVRDVIANWGDVVRIAEDPAEFIAEVEGALAETPADIAAREAREDEILGECTWDHIADSMKQLIDAAMVEPTTMA